MARPMRLALRKLSVIVVLMILSTACSGGGGGGSSSNSGLESANFDCDGNCAHRNLSSADVKTIISQFAAAAEDQGISATIAVVDRVGNVLGVYAVPGANPNTTINGQIGASGGLEGSVVPASLAAISKAGTGAYLSSQGNAFSSRTASQIVQENFNPGEKDQAGGPLFGVQFSQLPCSDINSGGIGPKALPLGLSADPGGIPLYKEGDLVGGVGVEFDGNYRLDRDITDYDDDPEERLALYASRGFETPAQRAADNVFIAGRSLRFTDLSYGDLSPTGEEATQLDPSGFLSLSGFTSGSIRNGAVYGTASSGVRQTSRAGIASTILVNAAGQPRFPTRAGAAPAGAQLKVHEVDAILDSAITTAYRVRGGIRTPLDSQAHVSIFVVDALGTTLGMTRTLDGPVFGIDVALQKARTAAFFSSSDAGARLNAAGLGNYVAATNSFLGINILNGSYAISNRAIGNLSRPFFTDGIIGNPNGPLSLPFPGRTGSTKSWSPFNTGLQFDLFATRLGNTSGCADPSVFGGRLRNGIQIFSGSVPLYRGNTLIGAIGVSGDGVTQDDLIAFYGASRTGLDYAGHANIGDPVLGFNAPLSLRADKIEGPFSNTRLRYVNCPEAPFRGSNEQDVCDS